MSDSYKNRFKIFKDECPFYIAFKPLLSYGRIFGQIYLTTANVTVRIPFLLLYCLVVLLVLISAEICMWLFLEPENEV